LFPENVYYFLLVRKPVKDWTTLEGQMAATLGQIRKTLPNVSSVEEPPLTPP
jgi:hypothetical protein